MSVWSPKISARQGDALTALVLSVLLVLELALGSHIDGPAWANYPFGLVITGAVAFRRPWPVWAFAAELVSALISTIANGDLTENPIAPFIAVIIVAYAVGAYPPARWSNFGLGIGILGLILIGVAGSDPVSDWTGTVLLAAVLPWTAGRVAREWVLRAKELERVNAALQAEQEQRLRLAAADERTRIARELHDVVAHSISVMVVQSEGAKRMMEREPERAQSALDQIEATGRAALVEMRRLLGVLRREDEDAHKAPQPGVCALDELVAGAREAGLEVQLEVDGESPELSAGVDVTLYRIVQEALTNVLKHAGPTHADVALHFQPEAVEVEVVDRGRVNGFHPPPPDPDNPQHGLLGMKERVSLYGGQIVTGPCEDGGDGYRVWARIPITTPA